MPQKKFFQEGLKCLFWGNTRVAFFALFGAYFLWVKKVWGKFCNFTPIEDEPRYLVSLIH
jgi:hypothetical protein